MYVFDKLAELKKSLKILYIKVEQNPKNYIIIILNSLFHKIEIVENVKEGLEKCEKENYDIVFIDIPFLKISETFKIIEEKKFIQKVILILFCLDISYLIKAIKLGVDGVILEPFDKNHIIKTIDKVVKIVIAEKFINDYRKYFEKTIDKQIKIVEKELTINDLTNLKNRYAFNDFLKSSKNKSLILINIDNFESINIIYGYENGNKVIRIIADRLRNFENVFYLGADEFAIVLDEDDDEKLYEFTKTLQKSLSLPIELDDFKIEITISIGIAKGNDLLKKAHLALKEAKKEGKNKIRFYTPNLSLEKFQAKIQYFTPILKKAIKEKRVEPFFQAIINNNTLEVEKFECLARIVCKDGKIYTPYHFIDVATLTGFLPDITKIMIDKSFQVFKDNNYEFSLNITENDLSEGYLIDYFNSKLKEYNISSSRVVLEVLEGVSVKGMEHSLNQLKELEKMGFKIAIDDFGTQNSNFERVNSIKVDYIKIDGAFVKNIDKDEKSLSIVKTITYFAKSIGAKTIAEFVHNEKVFKIIKSIGIDYSQGYYFSEPKRELITEINFNKNKVLDKI